MVTREGIKTQYPAVIFRTDFAAGVKMSMGQAVRHKRLQSDRAWPDLFIAEPKYVKADKEWYDGLFIELKAVNIYRKDGTLLSNPHIREQAEMLERLRQRGYAAHFAIGFDQARKIIDEYLK
jgi:hypothetical protein